MLAETRFEKTIKRLTSALLAAVVIFTAAVYNRSSSAVVAYGGSGIVNGGNAKDVFVNIDEETMALYGITDLGAFTAALRDAVIAQDATGTLHAGNVVINGSVTAIDTTDLTDWYVYDHYDTASGGYSGSEAFFLKKDADNYNAPKHPYFGVAEANYSKTVPASIAAGANYDIAINYPAQGAGAGQFNRAGVYTIREMLEGGPEVQMPWYGYLVGNQVTALHASPDAIEGAHGYLPTFGTSKYEINVRRLKEHIYTGSESKGAFMWFMGYGAYAHTDFLFYPAPTSGIKNIKFKIDSAGVRGHSMKGAGFLLNTAVDSAGYIHGYVLTLEFNGTDAAPSAVVVNLYKIADNVTAANFHNGASNGNNALQYGYITKVGGSATNTDAVFGSGATFSPTADLDISFDDATLDVKVRTDNNPLIGGSSTERSYVRLEGLSQNIAVSYRDPASPASVTSAYGFGPLVMYTGHSCGATSAYKFSELQMSFKTDAFENMLKYKYDKDQGTDRFFINLVSTPVLDSNIPGQSLVGSPDYEVGIGRLRQDKIFYVTDNPDNDVINGSGTNGSNGALITPAAKTQTDLIAALVDFILNGRNNPITSDTVNPPDPVTGERPIPDKNLVWDDGALKQTQSDKPVAGLTLWGKDTLKEGTLTLIENQQLDKNPIMLLVQDQSYIGLNGTLDYVKITVTDKSGNVLVGKDQNGGSLTVQDVTYYYVGGETDKTKMRQVTNKMGETVWCYPLVLLDETNMMTTGTYTVTITAYNTGGEASLPVEATFNVRKDDLPPYVAINEGTGDKYRPANDYDATRSVVTVPNPNPTNPWLEEITSGDAASTVELAGKNAEIYRGTSIGVLLSDNSDSEMDWGIERYKIGFGASIDDAFNPDRYGNLITLTELWKENPYPLTINDLDKRTLTDAAGTEVAAEYLFVIAYDWVGNSYTFIQPIAPYRVTYVKDNAFGIDLGITSPPKDANLYRSGERYWLKPTFAFDDGVYEVIGWNTDKFADAPLSDPYDTITGNMTLYPILRYNGGAAADFELKYDNSKPVTTIKTTVTCDDPDSDIEYFVVPFDPDDPLDPFPGLGAAGGTPVDPLTALKIINENGGSPSTMPALPHTTVSDKQIATSFYGVDKRLAAGGKYYVIVKCTDGAGNIGYKVTEIFDVPIKTPPPAPTLAPTAVPDLTPTETPAPTQSPSYPGYEPRPTAPAPSAKPPTPPLQPSQPPAPKPSFAPSPAPTDGGGNGVPTSPPSGGGTTPKNPGTITTGTEGGDGTDITSVIDDETIVTDFDKKTVEDGGDMNIKLIVEPKTPSQATIDDIKRQVGGGDITIDEIGIEINKKVYDKDGNLVDEGVYTRTGEPLLIQIALTAEQVKNGAQIYKLVGGMLTLCGNVSNDPACYAFETDELGEYIIITRQTYYSGGEESSETEFTDEDPPEIAETETPDPNAGFKAPQTGQNSDSFRLAAAAAAISASLITVISLCLLLRKRK